MKKMSIANQKESNGGRKIYEYYWCNTCRRGVGYLPVAMWLFKKFHGHSNIEYHYVDENGKVH